MVLQGRFGPYVQLGTPEEGSTEKPKRASLPKGADPASFPLDQALRLSEDYFVLERDAFLRRWMPGKGGEIRRQTTGSSWKAIVEALKNPVQQEIVADDREQTSVLVLAGPGSGKTRVLVHRIA